MTARIQAEVAKAVAKETELARREIQSVKDRSTREVEQALRRTRLAESTQSAMRSSLKDLDPDIAKEMELTQLRAKEQGRVALDQEERIARQQTEFHNQFQSNLTQFITGLGLDPADKRIDWGNDAKNYLEAQERILNSVSKIQKENIQTAQSGLEKRLKDLEAKMNQANIEANSVNTAASGGAATGSDAEFLKKFGAGEIPADKENVSRYKKIIKTY